VQHQEDAVAYDVEEDDELTAVCALCTNEDCGSLVVLYRTAGAPSSDLWDFVCSRCGLAFSVPEGELVFQSIAVEMLFARLVGPTHAKCDDEKATEQHREIADAKQSKAYLVG
jgi:hypothetical protein